MKNPWEEIKLDDYESHMKLDSVYQIQTMNKMMKEQFYTYPIQSIMILGIAGGNGLEHIETQQIHEVIGVDINKAYLEACQSRYPHLEGILKLLCIDLTKEYMMLPKVDLLVANLLIEYIGYECFQKVVLQVQPQVVSCIIQINTDNSFVSDSPYLRAFDRLDSVHHQMEEAALVSIMGQIHYVVERIQEEALPNGKKLVRIDFKYNHKF